MIIRRCPVCKEEWWLVNTMKKTFFMERYIDRHIDLVMEWELETSRHIPKCRASDLAEWESLKRSYEHGV